MLGKFWYDPFAIDGQTATVPDTIQPDGSLSYQQGFGPDYSLDPDTFPSALLVPRQEFNEILFQITQSIALIQSDFPQWISASDNGGTAYTYNIDAVVRYTDGNLYQSTANANSTQPLATSANWVLFLSQYALTSALDAEIARAEAAEALLAPIANPTFTGTPKAPTAAPGTQGEQISTLSFVASAVQAETSRAQTAEALLAPLASPNLTGSPTAPTATAGTNSAVLANCAFVTAAVAVETSRATTALNNEISRAEAAEALLAPLASPTLTGNPQAPTKMPGTNNTFIATCAFVTAAVQVETNRALTAEALLAPLLNPALQGVPTAPTPPLNSSDFTIPNTSWVRSLLPAFNNLAIRYAIGTITVNEWGYGTIPWNQPFASVCLAPVASCNTNADFNPITANNNFVAVPYAWDVNGVSIRVDADRGGSPIGNVPVTAIAVGL